MLATKRIDVVNGRVTEVTVVPSVMVKQQKSFAKMMDRQGAWMPESNMKQIIEAYNEAFDKMVFGD